MKIQNIKGNIQSNQRNRKKSGWQKTCLCLLSICLLWAGTEPAVLARTINTSSTRSIQPYLDRVVSNVTEFRLNNGMKFIVLKRPQAPVVSFVVYADVGATDEPIGQTGVAHYLEHLAFKGTKRIGTTDYSAEAPLLEKMDQVFGQILNARQAGDQALVKELEKQLSDLEKQAGQYVKQNEFGQIIEQHGGVGLNAATSADATFYFYSLPANKLEFWMSLESERFLEPVFREFYKEKQVILEERRMRTDNSPVGRMVEEFLGKSFDVHPYGRPVIGFPEDLENLTRENVEDFFRTYYVPNNLTVAIVGDVDPAEVKRLAEIYFGRYASGNLPPKLTKVEPPQTATKEFSLELPTQPWYLEGYHRPPMNHPDHVVYEMLTSIMSDGRTSRLYRSLVEDKQIALVAEGSNGYPGDKYANLLLFYAQTAPGHTVDEVATSLQAEIERLKTEPVTAEELQRVKTQAKASLLGSLDSNLGMAFAFAEYQAKTGSWQNLFKQLDAIEAVTVADIQRVAQQTFRPENRTVGKLLSKPDNEVEAKSGDVQSNY